MTKTMEINELISELKEYDGELTVKVWSNGTNKAYPISHVGQGHTDGVLDTYVSIVVDDDRNLVDLSKIWHDASEEPNNGSNIVAIDKDGQWLDIQPYHSGDYGVYGLKGWSCCILNYNNIQKWAYISDLLPKGGEK